jgi:F-type H+-transporting ATPase subunit gamma
MAESLKILRRRVRSIKSTKQITRAMQMVSAAKLRRAQSVLLAARPYIQHLEMLLGRLAPDAAESGHPCFTTSSKKEERITLAIFTGDRGLCGSYNSNLIRIAEATIERLGGRDLVDLIFVGKRGASYFLRRKYAEAGSFTDWSGVVDRPRAEQIGIELTDRFLSGKADKVYLLYNAYISMSSHVATLDQFLPLEGDALLRKVPEKERQALEYLYEPNRTILMDRLVPAYLRSKLFITLAEALTSEHSARMLAMNNATGNCDEMIDMLTLHMNKARQGSITNDLLDIVGGAEALQKA